ncbi:MAG: diheme cytochrome c [Mariprofundus sp.]|nr:diheme cytochrome c [Mariprofundus sp.]
MIRFGLLLMMFFTMQSAFAADSFMGIPRFKGVESVKSKVYQSNCAECHFAYFPGLLPARSWQKLMTKSALKDHFDENAELDEGDRQEILAFLVEHAADHSHYKRSIKIRRSIPQLAAPLRITEVPYIKRKHSEIPARLIKGNKKVRSLSNCARCHTQAEDKGVFDDDTVFIKGYGVWDD